MSFAHGRTPKTRQVQGTGLSVLTNDPIGSGSTLCLRRVPLGFRLVSLLQDTLPPPFCRVSTFLPRRGVCRHAAHRRLLPLSAHIVGRTVVPIVRLLAARQTVAGLVVGLAVRPVAASDAHVSPIRPLCPLRPTLYRQCFCVG